MHADDRPVVLEHVAKRYESVTALRDVTFDVRRGEMFGLIGPDGAGKTTTIRLMCGLLHADGGTIRVVGRDPAREHGAIARSVGYLSQRFSLYGDLSIDENIAFFAEIHGVRDYGPRRDRLLAITQLAPFRGRLADRLSGGMKQKLALACTLIHEPDLIVLDEPTTGVDPVSRREFWKLLSEFLSHGITIVMSTPYLDEAERCTRVVLMHEGRVIAFDEPSALRASLSGAVLEVMADKPDVMADALATQAAPLGLSDVRMFGERAHVRVDSTEPSVTGAIRAQLERAGLADVSIRHVPASLEDVFIARIVNAPAGAER